LSTLKLATLLKCFLRTSLPSAATSRCKFSKTQKLRLSKMRILLDESVPEKLGKLLVGHSFSTVQRQGWTSVNNGLLLSLAKDEFDVLLTADKGMEYQQNQDTLPVAILVVRAKSNRMEDLGRAVPSILAALEELPPRTLRKPSA